MNKKVFTLLAASLMLFMTAFTANAGRPWVGDTVRYLPEGTGKGAYHLKVTHIGERAVKDTLLIMDRYGYVDFADSSYVWGKDSSYIKLRSALWCVTVKNRDHEFQGRVPVYTFLNKEYGAEMAFDKMGFTQKTYTDSISKLLVPDVKKIVGQEDLPLVGGPYAKWKFSRTYNTVALETEQYLAIDMKSAEMPDYYMTFAVPQTGPSAGKLRLVIAHKNEFEPGTHFWKKELVRFTLLNASPRVLTAADFNTRLRQNAKEGFVQMFFDPDVSKDQVNPFAQELKADDDTNAGMDNNYITLQTKAGKYLHMSTSEYHSVSGILYPKILEDGKGKADMQSLWRLVYYPSEDSLIVNVKGYKGHTAYTDHEDRGGYDRGEMLYTQEMWDFLILRLQDLDAQTGKRVITVANKPANTRIHFKINNCQLFDTDRTTVKSDLYTVRDREGRYLVVPLYAGDFTPQWLYLDENEVANMTPSCQWFVKQVNPGSEISKIHLVNREFENIQIEYVQIYNDYHLFNGVWKRLNPKNPADYSPIVGKNMVKKDGFVRVPKPYRNDPYLGYRFFSKNPDVAKAVYEAADSINWFAYSFNYLSGFGKNFYMGFDDNAKDTILYALKGQKTYFRLVLPDNLRTGTTPVKPYYQTEKYGIGWTDGILTGDFSKESSEDYIAKLNRWYYHLQVNDYWKFRRNLNYVVLDDNARYGYTDEEIANSRKLNKAKFYLRFTYRVDGVNYYTLIDRIDASNFHHLTDITGLSITDTLRAYDDSHGKFVGRSYGVIQAAVTDRDPNYIRGQVKTLGTDRVSAFAISYDTEPLYRRFNTMDESAASNDNPDTLKFFRTYKQNHYIYEDAHSVYSSTKKQLPNLGYSSINFMGVQNEDDAIANKDKDQIFKRHLETDWAIYVDTAYVNRGTGHIKPQYLLVVDPKFGYLGCPVCGEDSLDRPYIYGRYLRNMTDSARVDKNNKGSKFRDPDYVWNSQWERLAFVHAIHAGDSLYILNGRPIEDFYVKGANGITYVNYKKLRNDKMVVIRNLANNLHKDEVFSFRFIEKGGGVKKDFLIESETTDRNAAYGAMIAPIEGGWVKVQNGVPVISRGSYKDFIEEAGVWNVAKTNKKPLANDEVSATDVVVVAGVGHVNVRNASGKKVTVSNVLGQTVARVVLTSDNETIVAPKGVVVVAVEGENAVKAVVK